MPDNMVRKFSFLKELGPFHDYRHGEEKVLLRKRTLIYGLNGSGKTTLSRVLRSIEEGRFSGRLPPGGSFEVEFPEGTAIGLAQLNPPVRADLAVFNSDFIDECFRWQDGYASPFVYIGREQVRLSRQKENLEKRWSWRENHFQKSIERVGAVENNIAGIKHQHALTITNVFALGRRYNAGHLDDDLGRPDAASYKIVTPEEAEELNRFQRKEEPYPRASDCVYDTEGLSNLGDEAQRIGSTTLSHSIVGDLGSHAIMAKWVIEGAVYHRDHGLDHCLLCTNKIEGERLRQFQDVVDLRLASTSDVLADVIARLQQHDAELSKFAATLPRAVDIDSRLHAEYVPTLEALVDTVNQVRQDCKAAILALKQKQLDVTRVIGDVASRIRTNGDLIRSLATHVESLSKIIARHNDAVSKFNDEREAAQTKLKQHLVALARDALKVDVDALAEATARKKYLQRWRNTAFTALEAARQRLMNIDLPIQAINKLLKSYLGHEVLSVTFEQPGFYIRRNGRPITGPLSEGEKTAVALSYFVAKLEEGGRKLDEMTIAVDDPISSLDSAAVNFVAVIMQAVLAKSRQSIVLTHNLAFFNEMKKWQKRFKNQDKRASEKAKLEGKPAPIERTAFLFLEVEVSADLQSRTTKIVPLSKLLREYDSEYHYLFKLVKEFAEGGNETFAYLMPNTMRKVLELFLAFKVPGNNPFEQKLESEVVKGKNLSADVLGAIARLTQVESHGDNLNELIEHCSMTVEESRRAAQGLMTFFAALDEPHHKQMCDLCAN